MSTKSIIARMNKDNSYTTIYCHWDGYPSHNGKLLLENYNTLKLVNDLMDLGDLSALREEIGIKHPFDEPSRHLPPKGKIKFMEKVNPLYTEYKRKYGDMCRAYGRDRQKHGTEAKHYKDYDALEAMLKASWYEWLYVYRVETGKWYYTNNPSPTWFKTCDPMQMQTAELTLEACKEREPEKEIPL